MSKTKELEKEIENLKQQLQDALLHNQEFGFERECEKFVDECAIRAMQSLTVKIPDGDLSSLAKQCYIIAEAMLKEKLKRNEKLS
jgi:hypothetical protein